MVSRFLNQSKGSDSLLRSSLASGASIAIHVAPAPEFVKVSMAWVGGKPPTNYEKL